MPNVSQMVVLCKKCRVQRLSCLTQKDKYNLDAAHPGGRHLGASGLRCGSLTHIHPYILIEMRILGGSWGHDWSDVENAPSQLTNSNLVVHRFLTTNPPWAHEAKSPDTPYRIHQLPTTRSNIIIDTKPTLVSESDAYLGS